MRILIVDDEPLVGRSCCRILRAHEVDLAETAEEGIALHRARPYELAFVDLNLADGVSGLECAHLLVKVCPLRVVLITGDAGIARAPFEVLCKPFSASELAACV